MDAGVEDSQAACRGLQRPGDVGAVRVFGEVAAGPGPQRVKDGVVVDVGGEDDDGDAGVLGSQPASGADAV